MNEQNLLESRINLDAGEPRAAEIPHCSDDIGGIIRAKRAMKISTLAMHSGGYAFVTKNAQANDRVSLDCCLGHSLWLSCRNAAGTDEVSSILLGDPPSS